MANIKYMMAITTNTFMILPTDSMRADTISFKSGFLDIILRGLNTLNSLKILTKPILSPDYSYYRVISTMDESTMKQSS